MRGWVRLTGALALLAVLAWPGSLLAVSPARAADYYLDAQAGQDGAPGNSPDAAWQSLARLARAELRPGDRVLFRRGQIFRGNLRLSASGAAGAPIVFTAYGEGDRPSLRGSRDFNQPHDWTPAGPKRWHLRLINRDPTMFLADGRPGQRVARPEDLAHQWDFWYDALRRRLVVCSEKRPTELARTLETAVEEFVIGPQTGDHTVFRSLDFRQAASSLWLGWGADNVAFEDCTLAQAGENCLQFNNASHDGRISDCTFDDWNLGKTLGYAVQVITGGSGPVDIEGCLFTATTPGGGQDHTAVMNDQEGWVRTVRGCRFQGNQGRLADEGVVIWRPAARADEVVIEANRFLGLGGSAVQIQELEHHGAWPRVIVRANYISQACLGDDEDKEALRLRDFSAKCQVTAGHNIISGAKAGKFEHPGIGLKKVTGALVLHNTVVGCDVGLAAAQGTSAVNAVNNIFLSSRTVGIRVEPGSGLGREDHNLVFGSGRADYEGLSPGQGDLNQDPGLTERFTLAPDSPARGAGVWVDQARDFRGAVIPPKGPIDLGAVQGD